MELVVDSHPETACLILLRVVPGLGEQNRSLMKEGFSSSVQVPQ